MENATKIALAALFIAVSAFCLAGYDYVLARQFLNRLVVIEDIVFKTANAVKACSDAIQDFAAKLIKLYTEVYKIDVRLVRLENLFNATAGELT